MEAKVTSESLPKLKAVETVDGTQNERGAGGGWNPLAGWPPDYHKVKSSIPAYYYSMSLSKTRVGRVGLGSIGCY